MKHTLAINGGPAARSKPDPARTPLVGTALYDELERSAVDDVIRERLLWRYHGTRVAEFERRFAARIHATTGHALAVNSGTSALYLAFAALDLPEGTEIIMPTFGFVSAVTAAAAAGLIPRFVAVDAGLGIDIRRLDRYPDARAILAVHPYGAACDVLEVTAWAQRTGAIVIEDVAQAMGATLEGQPLGSFGAVSAFSFQHFKLLSTGEGGMCVTGDEQLADRMEVIHDAAADWTIPARAARVPRVRRPPLNLRMSEIEAAIGLVQLDRVEFTLKRLGAIHAKYVGAVKDALGIRLRPLSDPGADVGTSLIVHLPTAGDADWTVRALQSEGIRAGMLLPENGTNRHWAGDWHATLNRCGVEGPPSEVVEHDRDMLAGAIVVPVDITLDEQDIDETALALAKVVGGTV